MYTLKKDLHPGTVVWANRKIYYDRPDQELFGKRAMYLITSLNTNYFFGCPLTTNTSKRNGTILRSRFYPIKHDSRVNECLYQLEYEDIIPTTSFAITENTFKNFKRNLYKKIVIGAADSPSEYNDVFVEEYLLDNKPPVDSILVYPSDEKVFYYYYVCSNHGDHYTAIRLNEKSYNYTVAGDDLIEIPKSIRFYDYFTTYNMSSKEKQKIKTIEKGKM